MVYTLLVAMMVLSSFGLPIPEEVTLLSVGLIAYMGAHPEIYPPPYEGAPVVNPIFLAVLATVVVFSTDFLIYAMGRIWGRKLITHRYMARMFSPPLLEKAESFTRKYGMLATGIFRFTPGVRFPGHLLCGILKFSPWKFAMIDGFAVMISVPTQVFLLAYYGEHILGALKQFKTVVFSILGILLIAFIAIKLRNKYQRRNIRAEDVALQAVQAESKLDP